MHPAHQLAVCDDAAAHAGADEEHCGVGAALQRPGPQLGKSGGLAVVFQHDRAAAPLPEQLPHRGGGVVQQCAAVGHKTGAAVHKARQRHGNAGHFVPVGRVKPVDGVQKLLLRVLRGGHRTGIGAVQPFVHHRILDLGAANVKNHDLHNRFPP